jgi:hypothetical protein
MQTTPKIKTAKEKRPDLPRPVVSYVWMRCGGRCAFAGCNTPLWKDILTNTAVNTGLIAHIVSWTPSGPRGDVVFSPKLARDPDNLMLLCPTHHDLVDDHPDAYPRELLLDYKSRHEARVETLTAIDEDRRTTILLFQAPVGPHADPMRTDHARLAAAGTLRYPREQVLPINLTGLGSRDHEPAYWPTATRMISEQLRAQLATHRHEGRLDHISVFGFGPIPLLVYLGRELGDKVDADVYNLHRAPKGWRWPRDGKRYQGFSIVPETRIDPGTVEVGLLVSVSSNVQRDHVRAVLPGTLPLIELRTDVPMTDALRHPDDLAEFFRAFQRTMERIHNEAPHAVKIHLFAGVPVACAVEMGRALLPKLHAPLLVYDFHRATNGFVPAITIGSV